MVIEKEELKKSIAISDTKMIEKAKQYASGLTLLLVEDDSAALNIYQDELENIFASVDVVSDGKEAYAKWSQNKSGYDLIITDINMPLMNGFDLIKKIREISVEQKFIMLSAIEDMNEMRDIINLGIDGIVTKPFNQNVFLTVACRVFQYIHNNKTLKTQVRQLKLLALEKVSLKRTLQKSIKTEKQREPKISKIDFKQESVLIKKYDTRQTLDGGSSSSFLSDLDYMVIDKIDDFQDKLIKFEALVCNCSFTNNAIMIRENLSIVSTGLKELVTSFNSLGKFAVAANAAENLIALLENLTEKELEEKEKRELMLDMLLFLLQDINEWIITVFIKQDTENINYFDASFANSCLEIEAIFNSDSEEVTDEEDALEFF